MQVLNLIFFNYVQHVLECILKTKYILVVVINSNDTDYDKNVLDQATVILYAVYCS